MLNSIHLGQGHLTQKILRAKAMSTHKDPLCQVWEAILGAIGQDSAGQRKVKLSLKQIQFPGWSQHKPAEGLTNGL